MTYSLSFLLSENDSRKITMGVVHLTDTLNAGMFEHAIDTLWSWHDVKKVDVERVLQFIELYFKPTEILINEEHTSGSYCQEKVIVVIHYSDK